MTDTQQDKAPRDAETFDEFAALLRESSPRLDIEDVLHSLDAIETAMTAGLFLGVRNLDNDDVSIDKDIAALKQMENGLSYVRNLREDVMAGRLTAPFKYTDDQVQHLWAMGGRGDQ